MLSRAAVSPFFPHLRSSATAARARAMSSISAREFEAALPAVLAAISRASFVAIDCEFSGLAPRPALRQTALDCVDARWAKVRAAAGAMQLLQFGVCTFELEAPPPPAALSAAGDGAAGDGAAAAAAPAPPPRFIARPFAFHLFPRASAGGRGADAEGDDDVTFLSSAGSLGFLSSHGFDLNAAVAGGVSYMSRDAERRLRHARRAAVVRSFLRDPRVDGAARGAPPLDVLRHPQRHHVLRGGRGGRGGRGAGLGRC